MKKLLLIVALLLCPLFGLAQATTGFHRVSQVLARAPQGGVTANIVPNAKITVTRTSTGLAATIYSDPLLTAQIIPALVTADFSGSYSYYIPLNYCVTETITAPGQQTQTIRNICINGGGGSSGVSSLNSLTGGINLTSTGNTVTITPSGSTIDLEASGGITQLTGDGSAGPGSGSQTFTLNTVGVNKGGTGATTPAGAAANIVNGNPIAPSSVAATGRITGLQIGPTYQVDSAAFGPGTDPSVQINACAAQLYAVGGGTCDASMYTGSYTLANEIDWGSHAHQHVPMFLILPQTGNWTWNLTGGQSGIVQFDSTSILPLNGGVSENKLQLLAGPNARMAHVYTTDPSPPASGSYVKVGGFLASVESGGILTGSTVNIQNLFDESDVGFITASPGVPSLRSYASGGSCTTEPEIGFRQFGGVIQAAYVLGVGAGCGTGSGITWSTLPNGTGATFTTSWSGGALSSVTVTAGGTGYPPINPYAFAVDGVCCGSTIHHLAGGGLITGTTQLATGVTTTASSNVVTFTGITTENTTLLVGASVRTVDNLNPVFGANGISETIPPGTITAVTGTTITVSNAATRSATNEILEITPSGGSGGSGGSQIKISDSTINAGDWYESLPILLAGGNASINFETIYSEQDNQPSSPTPELYIPSSSLNTSINAYCSLDSDEVSKPCVETADNGTSSNSIYAGVGNYFGLAVLDKFWGTSVLTRPGAAGGTPLTPQGYSHLSMPWTIANFIPNTVGWYRLVDTSILPQQGAVTAGDFEVQCVGGDSVWSFTSGFYGQPTSLALKRALYQYSSWGPITKAEVSISGVYVYVDLYVSSTASSPCTVIFSNAAGLPGGAIIPTPVVGATPASGQPSVIDLTTLTAPTPQATTGTFQAAGLLVGTGSEITSSGPGGAMASGAYASTTGGGAAIPTGPTSSTSGDAVVYTGTSGKQADGGGPPMIVGVATTGNLADWTDSGVANGLVPVWNSSTSKWTPGSGGTNISGGVLGSVPYQTAPGITGLTAANTSASTLCYTETGTGSVGAAPAWGSCAGSAATAFSALTGSTNNSATMQVGSGAILEPTASTPGQVFANYEYGCSTAGLATTTSGGALGCSTTVTGITIDGVTPTTMGYLDATSSIQTQLNGKQASGTYVTSVTGTAPVVSSGGTTPAISMHVADASDNGYLASADWSTFNGKQAALTLIKGTYVDGDLCSYTASGTLLNCNSAPGGTGTVTSFSAGNLSPLFTTSVATSTTTPALTFSLSNAAQNSVFAGPATGGSGAPSYQTAPTISAANMTSFPTLNQNTTGSAAKWTTARNLAGNSVDGSANVAFANKFIVQGTSDSGLSAAQFLGALATGILKNTTTTGVLSAAASSDVIGLWTGTCSSSTFLRGDGACASASGSSGLTVGTTTISGGTNGDVEYNNSGILGELARAGSGSAIPTGPTTSTSGDAVVYTGTSGQQADAGFAPAPALGNNVAKTSGWTLATNTVYRFTGSGASNATTPASVSTGFIASIQNAGTAAVTVVTGGPTLVCVPSSCVIPIGASATVSTDGTNFDVQISNTTPIRAGTWSISSATSVAVTFATAMGSAPTSCAVPPSASSATTGQPFATSLATTGFTVNVPISGTLAGTYQCVINNAN